MMSTLSLTLPMSQSYQFHTQPDLAAPEMAGDGRVKRDRRPVPFLQVVPTTRLTLSNHIYILALLADESSKAIAE